MEQLPPPQNALICERYFVGEKRLDGETRLVTPGEKRLTE